MKNSNAAAQARDLVDRLEAVSKQRAMTTPDEELVDLLWKAWSSSEGRHGRRYLMHLIRLAKRAPFDKKAKGELAQCLSEKSLRTHMPGLKAGKGARSLVKREVERIAPIEPLHRGRPPKGAPKPRFYKELLKALGRLGLEKVTERQAMRDYWEVGRGKRH